LTHDVYFTVVVCRFCSMDCYRMAIVRGKAYVAAALLVTLVYMCYTEKFTQLSIVSKLITGWQRTETRGKLFTNWTSIPAPNVVLPASFDSRNETFNCTKMNLMNMTFPVCHYTAQTDYFVTGRMLNGKYFEGNEVSRFIRLLRLDRRLQLVDIGANIGVYSLPAARVTSVLAVEPNWHSMCRLAKAVDLGGVISNITLVHNAVSNVRTTLNMGVHPQNQGNAFLINSTKCKRTHTSKVCNTLSPTRTILLNDLLPLMRSKSALMKIDVEGHEINVFTDPTAGQFFDQIDIPLVFMEWDLCKRYSAVVIQRLLDFFYSRSYTVFNVDNSKLGNSYLRWPQNVLLKKKTHIGLHF